MEKSPKQQFKYCLNCHYPLPPNPTFCPKCSQKVTDGRVSFGEMVSEFFGAVFNFDSRLFQTMGALFVPGKLTTEYFKGRHRRYVHPLRVFLVMTVGLIAATTFSIDDPDFMGMQEDLIRDKIKQKHYEFLVELDTMEAQTKEQFPQVIVAEAMDTLFKKVAHGKSLDDKDSTHLIRLSDTEFLTDIPISLDDLLNLGTVEIIDKYKVEGTVNRFLVSQQIRLKREGGSFGGFLIGNLTWMIFLMMPFLAMILKLLYIRRNYYYVEHLIFSFHIHAFAFLIYIVMLLFGYHNEGLIIGGGFVLLFVYLYKAMRRVYKQGRLKTFVKYITTGICYIVILCIAFTLTILASVALY